MICNTWRIQIWSIKYHFAIRESLKFIYFIMQLQSYKRMRKHENCIQKEIIYIHQMKHYKSHLEKK